MEPVLDEELGAAPPVYLALLCYAEAMGLGHHGPSDLGAASLGFLLATGSVALGAIIGFVAVVWWIWKLSLKLSISTLGGWSARRSGIRNRAILYNGQMCKTESGREGPLIGAIA